MAKAPDDERVTVVVISHNRCEELDRTLWRLAALPEEPPVIVVNNASTDGTEPMVRTLHPEVTLLTPATNLGAAGRNHGVRLAATPYVAFCDDDTWYEPGGLRRAADLLDAHPALAVVTAGIAVEQDDICAETAASPLDRTRGMPGGPLLSFLAGASIVRRRAFLATGGFSTRLWPGREEELLASDLLRAGWQLTYVPDVVAHRHAPRLRDAQLDRRYGIRNTLWFTWLRRPSRSAVARTIRLLRQLPLDQVSAEGVVDALRGLPWVLRERHPVPADLERNYQRLEDMQRHGDA
ncbi:MAG TPA: glycosyltransferase [Mycobacterium sp.]|nr:glycosyltransferase [Mycobacterium sp.]